MRHLAATSLLLITLLGACGQKGPLVLPDKAKHKTIPTVPMASPLPPTGKPAVSPAPATGQPATASPPTPTP